MIAAEQFDCLSVDEVGMMLGDKNIREYPVFEIYRGMLTKKKIKFVNPQQTPLRIRIDSERLDICTIKEKLLEIPQASQGFIRLRILVPNNVKINTDKFEVTVYDNDTDLIYQTLKFSINLV